ncbi:MAG: hypothetical protein ACM3KD_11765 [Hyphomicrobiaceae bacterium]
MTKVIRLTWSGRETAADAIEAIGRRSDVEISLPADLHHALCRRLQVNAAEPKTVEVAGGAELIGMLAGMAGLEALAVLADPLRRAGYRLELRSPGPVLSLIPPLA